MKKQFRTLDDIFKEFVDYEGRCYWNISLDTDKNEWWTFDGDENNKIESEQVTDMELIKKLNELY